MAVYEDLAGKVAIVTGGSRGIGRAVAERLGREGVSVVVNYADNADAAQDAASAIEAASGEALAVQADTSQIEEPGSTRGYRGCRRLRGERRGPLGNGSGHPGRGRDGVRPAPDHSKRKPDRYRRRPVT